MNNFTKIFACLVVLFLFAASIVAQNLTADLIVINAKVRTMDDTKPSAEAIAVMDNKIVAVGSNAEIRQMADAKTRTIDAQGKLVIPGFNDAHVHFLEGGYQLSSVDLRDAKTPAEFTRRIKEFAAKLPKGRWILGGKWDHENWSPNNLPTAAMIDAVTPDNPVFIDRLDGHMALANSLAFKMAGVDKNTKDVAGGEIVRDFGGVPTGVLKDAAMNYVGKVIPAFTFAEKLEQAQAATDYAASLGVTSVQDMSAGTDVAVYQELARLGKLKTRIYGCSPLSDYSRWEKTGVHRAFGNDWIRVGCLKGYADGSLGSTTAWFFAAYLDAPNTSGLASDEIPKMQENVKNADKAGLQINIHAIGDKANDTVLSVFEKISRENGMRDRRFRVEHAQHLRLADLKRFGQLKVTASMQPFHLADDGRWAHKRLDEPRLKGTYAFRTLLDSGGTLAFGTDWYVAPLNPMLGVQAAVTRQTLDGKNPNGWIPEQKISVAEAVRAYTNGSAYAEFQENVKGSISIGKLADFVILSDDIFSINPTDINKTKVLTTVVGGKIVYEGK
ncbi:MAG: amidohydrolase [Acidobacteriota bacterium]|nr:amidohydrolase [Acidobacteriota bacterium]